MLESENSRYGMRFSVVAYHTCTSGPVVDSMKYGSPIVAASSSRIRATGSSAPVGFQFAPTMMGSIAALPTSRTTCRIARVRGRDRRSEACA